MNHIEFIKGDDYFGSFPVRDKEGNDITTADITMTCRLQPSKQSAIMFQKTSTNNEIVYRDGSWHFQLDKNDTKDMLTNVDYGYDIQCIYNGVTKTKVGTIKLNEQFTFGNEE